MRTRRMPHIVRRIRGRLLVLQPKPLALKVSSRKADEQAALLKTITCVQEALVRWLTDQNTGVPGARVHLLRACWGN